jgi:hypothetical protein
MRQLLVTRSSAAKTDAIPRGYRLRPVEALQAWLAAASITTGPIFRSVGKGDRVSAARLSAFGAAEIVKHHATRAGRDPTSFAGHSLRSGFLTSAAEHGASVFKMMEVSGHKSVDALRGYVRRVDLFTGAGSATATLSLTGATVTNGVGGSAVGGSLYLSQTGSGGLTTAAHHETRHPRSFEP